MILIYSKIRVLRLPAHPFLARHIVAQPDQCFHQKVLRCGFQSAGDFWPAHMAYAFTCHPDSPGVEGPVIFRPEAIWGRQ